MQVKRAGERGGGEGERSDGRAAASTYTSAGARACCARTTERVARTPAVWGMVRAPRDGSVVRGGGKWRTGGRNNHIAHLLAAHKRCAMRMRCMRPAKGAVRHRGFPGDHSSQY